MDADQRIDAHMRELIADRRILTKRDKGTASAHASCYEYLRLAEQERTLESAMDVTSKLPRNYVNLASMVFSPVPTCSGLFC